MGAWPEARGLVTILDDGYGGYLALALAGVVAHEPWRWLGLVLGRNLSVTSEIFQWVRAVATALVAGLVTRLVFFPAGGLAAVTLPVRLSAIAVGLAAFFGFRRNLGLGVAAASLALLLGAIATGARF